MKEPPRRNFSPFQHPPFCHLSLFTAIPFEPIMPLEQIMQLNHPFWILDELNKRSTFVPFKVYVFQRFLRRPKLITFFS